MEKRYYGLLAILLVVFAVTIFFYSLYGKEFIVEEKHFCNPAQRLVNTCYTFYQPVCGWSDPDKIQCIRYPCASTYSNSCLACVNEDVLYWTEDVCPSG